MLRRVMKVFRLFIKIGDQWELACSVQATDRDAAMREALMLLKPNQRELPRELKEDGVSPEK